MINILKSVLCYELWLSHSLWGVFNIVLIIIGEIYIYTYIHNFCVYKYIIYIYIHNF